MKLNDFNKRYVKPTFMLFHHQPCLETLTVVRPPQCWATTNKKQMPVLCNKQMKYETYKCSYWWPDDLKRTSLSAVRCKHISVLLTKRVSNHQTCDSNICIRRSEYFYTGGLVNHSVDKVYNILLNSGAKY